MVSIRLHATLRVVSHIIRYGETFDAFPAAPLALDGGEKEKILQTLPGTLEGAEEACTLRYREEDGTETALTFPWDGAEVTVRRNGAVRSEMRFLPGRVTPFVYATPYGELRGEMHTHWVKSTLHGRTGGIALCYDCLLSGTLQRTLLSVTLSGEGRKGECR